MRLVKFFGEGIWVAVPSWQVVLNAEDPVAILSDSEALPTSLPGKPEEVLVVIDRAQREGEPDNYFVVEPAGQLEFQWFVEAPDLPLLRHVILVMRPKRILDKEDPKDLWQIDQ